MMPNETLGAEVEMGKAELDRDAARFSSGRRSGSVPVSALIKAVLP